MAKTRRRVLSILMALVLALGLLPTAALADGSWNIGDETTTATEAQPEGTIPANSAWELQSKTPVRGENLVCEDKDYENGEPVWADPTVEANWTEIDASEYKAEDAEHYKTKQVPTAGSWTYQSRILGEQPYDGTIYEKKGSFHYEETTVSANDAAAGTVQYYGRIPFLGYIELTAHAGTPETVYYKLNSRTASHTDECYEITGYTYHWRLVSTLHTVTITVERNGDKVGGVDVTLTNGTDTWTAKTVDAWRENNYGKVTFTVPNGTYTASVSYTSMGSTYKGSVDLTVSGADVQKTLNVSKVQKVYVGLHVDLDMSGDGFCVDRAPETVTVTFADGEEKTFRHDGQDPSSAQWRYPMSWNYRDYYILDDDTNTSGNRIVKVSATFSVNGQEYEFTADSYAELLAANIYCASNEGMDFVLTKNEETPTYWYQVVYRLYNDLSANPVHTVPGTVTNSEDSVVNLGTLPGSQQYNGSTYNKNRVVLSNGTTVDPSRVDISAGVMGSPMVIYVDYVKQQTQNTRKLDYFVRLDGTVADNASKAGSWDTSLYTGSLMYTDIKDVSEAQNVLSSMVKDQPDTWIYEATVSGDINNYIRGMLTPGSNGGIQVAGMPTIQTLANYLNTNKNYSIKIAGKDVTADIIARPENYDIYWYVLKNEHSNSGPYNEDWTDKWDESNTYHIDGVVVMKEEATATLTITKTFVADSQADLTAVMATGAFHLDVTDAQNAAVQSGLTATAFDSNKNNGYLTGVTLGTAAQEGGKYQQTVTWTLELPKGTYTVAEDTSGAGNSYTVAAADNKTSDTADLTSADDSVSFTNTYTKRTAGVTIAKTVAKTAYQVGDTVTYTITATNSASATASANGVEISDTLDSCFEDVRVTSAKVGGQAVTTGYSVSDNKVTWNVGTLAVGQSAELIVTAKIKSDVLGGPNGTKLASVTIPNTATVQYTGSSPISSAPVEITVTEKTYSYKVQYEYMLAVDSGTPASQGTSAQVSFEAASEPTLDAVFALALENVAGSNVSLTYENEAGQTYTYAKHSSRQEDDVTDNKATFESGNRVYTVKVYYQDWRTGSMTISKTFSGLTSDQIAEVAKTLTFTVTTPNTDVTFPAALVNAYTGSTANQLVIPYSAFADGKITLSGLTAAVYTITESGADVTGYTRTTTLNGESANSVTVQNGAAPAPAAFLNDYTGKTYTITFDAGEYGKVDGRTGTWTWTWTKYEPKDADSYYDWAGLATGTSGSKVVFTFTQDQYLTYKDQNLKISSDRIDLTVVVDGATAKTGTTTVENPVANGEYYFNNGEIFTSIADAYATMNAANVTSITYTADYTFTYTFNDYGSSNVEMGYWVAGQEGNAPTAVTAFNTKVTEQAGLENIDNYQTTIFFVKAKSGYQINETSSLKCYEGTKSGTEETGMLGVLETAEAPYGMSAETWEAVRTAALEAGYTHCFGYADNSVFNHWFKVTATKDPVVALGGTKIVALGGNTAPGEQIFTFKLETFVENAEEEGPAAMAVNQVEDVPGYTKVDIKSKYVPTNGAGQYSFTVDEITYTEEGYYFYRLYEEIPESASSYWTYDQSVYYILVHVYEKDTTGQLVAEVSYMKQAAPDAETTEPADAAIFTNTYTRNTSTGPSDPGSGSGSTDIPDDNTPTTELPDEETPMAEDPGEETVEEIPDEETPLAEVPATGDTAVLWALAAGVSGLALVWLALTGKKRREENA